MERREAVARLKALEGQDLHALAAQYDVTVCTPSGTVNKGWAGHVCERFLGLPQNSAQNPILCKTMFLKTFYIITLIMHEISHHCLRLTMENVFDWHKWNAETYEKPEDIIRAFESLGVCGKRIAVIRIIGFASNNAQCAARKAPA